jgi:hypothetical protein
MILPIRNRGFLYWLLGCTLIIGINWPLLSTTATINWDAFDWLWTYLRWYGSALRAGYFPDFFPNILSGSPTGSEIQSGLYNPLYLFIAYIFPDSVLSVNTLYLVLQVLIFTISYLIAFTFYWIPLTNLYFALAITASGFVLAHASHIPFLSTFCGLLGLFLGLRYAVLERPIISFAIAFLSTFHLLSSGYPQNIFFGTLCLLFYWIYLFFHEPSSRNSLWIYVLAGLSGIIVSIPSLWHFTNLVLLSDRSNGLTPIEAMQNSMPSYAILNYFYPTWKMGYSEPTMERFHLLWLSVPLTVLAAWYAIFNQSLRKPILVLFVIGTILTLLALGGNGIFPIRLWLAEHFFIFRSSRHPSAEHRGIALFIFTLLTAMALNQLLLKFPKIRVGIALLLCLDFIWIVHATQDIRFSNTSERYHGKVPLFQAKFLNSDQYLIDQPRNCSDEKTDQNSSAIHINRDQLAPHSFYWSSFGGTRDQIYEKERAHEKQILCASGRLINASLITPQPYSLNLYSPSRIQFTVLGDPSSKPLELIWADYNDGFWRLKINGEVIQLKMGPANTRSFKAYVGDTIEMSYLGPFSALWRW